jgi:DNA-binding CsgD family transcriptional regulator
MRERSPASAGRTTPSLRCAPGCRGPSALGWSGRSAIWSRRSARSCPVPRAASGWSARSRCSSPAHTAGSGRAQLELGSRLRRDNERSAAREQLHAALEYAVVEGCAPIESRAREELRIMGGRPRNVIRTGIASLTGSEERIARLAAEGMTNKAIAQHLFLTVKTIESHLASVYRKLYVKGRKELQGALAGLVQGRPP